MCRLCGTRHRGTEHVFPDAVGAKGKTNGVKLCPKCGEPTGPDQAGKPKWCKCVRETADAAQQIIRKVMGKQGAIADRSDEPTDALTSTAKTDRKAYLREYMRDRRKREREESQRAAEERT